MEKIIAILEKLIILIEQHEPAVYDVHGIHGHVTYMYVQVCTYTFIYI